MREKSNKSISNPLWVVKILQSPDDVRTSTCCCSFNSIRYVTALDWSTACRVNHILCYVLFIPALCSMPLTFLMNFREFILFSILMGWRWEIIMQTKVNGTKTTREKFFNIFFFFFAFSFSLLGFSRRLLLFHVSVCQKKKPSLSPASKHTYEHTPCQWSRLLVYISTLPI